jgi:hypothetical protein
MGFETFMRTEIEAARQLLRLLNANLSGRADERVEYPAPEE